ncbi:unnamed protein product [Brassica rapa subsp. trilocularis]
MLQMCIIALPSCLYLYILTIRAYFVSAYEKEKKNKIEKKATKEKERQESLFPRR